MTRSGYTPAMLRRHPSLRAPHRPTWGGVLAIAFLFCALMLCAAWTLQLVRLP